MRVQAILQGATDAEGVLRAVDIFMEKMCSGKPMREWWPTPEEWASWTDVATLASANAAFTRCILAQILLRERCDLDELPRLLLDSMESRQQLLYEHVRLFLIHQSISMRKLYATNDEKVELMSRNTLASFVVILNETLAVNNEQRDELVDRFMEGEGYPRFTPDIASSKSYATRLAEMHGHGLQPGELFFIHQMRGHWSVELNMADFHLLIRGARSGTVDTLMSEFADDYDYIASGLVGEPIERDNHRASVCAAGARLCLNSVVPLHQFAVIKDGSISYRPDAVQEIKAAAKQLGEPHLDMRISSTGSIGSSVEKAREGGSGGQKAAAGKQGSFVAEVAELDRFQALSSINKNFRERSEPLTLGATAFNFNMRKAGELLGRAYQLRRGKVGAEESEEPDE